MARHKDTNWNLPDRVETWEQAQVALLMDIRSELKALNSTLSCYNFLRIPRVLDSIRKNTVKPRRRKKVK